MEITLYKNFSKRANSTKRPSGGVTFQDVFLKEDTSLYTPVIIWLWDNADPIDKETRYTYMKLNDTYYYIDDIVFIRNKTYELHCSIDVLATFKTEIGGTLSFIERSSVDFDVYINDPMLVPNETTDIATDWALLSGFGTKTYIVGVVTDEPNVGPSGIFALDETNALQLAKKVGSEDFNNFLQELVMSLNGAYESLLFCKVLPCEAYSGIAKEIHLGSYPSGINGYVPSDFSTSFDIAIDRKFGDFRDLNPYTTWQLFLPSYGYIELNPSDYMGRDNVHVELHVNCITGEAIYFVDEFISVTCNVGYDVPIGTISGNNIQYASGIASALIGVSTGGTGSLVSSLFGATAIASGLQRNIGSVGGASGSLLKYNPIDEDYKAVLTMTRRSTNVNPTNLTTTVGRPTNKVGNISAMGGFVKTRNASVKCSAPKSIIDVINNLLDGGIFYE